jgi:integrase
MFEYAIVHKYYHGNNPVDKKALKAALPKSREVHKVGHHKSLPYQDAARFREALLGQKNKPKGRHGLPGKCSTKALWCDLVLLTGARISEVRLAQWKEFDFEHMIWNLPPEHLKMGHIHGEVLRRPITKAMLPTHEELQRRRIDPTPEGFLINSDYKEYQGRGPADGRHLNHFIREVLQWEVGITGHGFRSTLRDWCRANRFPGEWWDIQIDHKLGDATSKAYGHDKLLGQRRGMMELWGNIARIQRPSGRPPVALLTSLRRGGPPKCASSRKLTCRLSSRCCAASKPGALSSAAANGSSSTRSPVDN